MQLRMMQAVRATGVAKSTIQRAIRQGRLTATVADDGGKLIDTAELKRVFGPLRSQGEPGRRSQPIPPAPTGDPTSPPASPNGDALADELRQRLHTAQVENERLRADLDRERRDLDRERQRADKLLEMLDRRLLPAPAEQTTNGKPPGTYSRQAPPAPTDQPEPAFLSMLKAVTGRR